MKDENHKKGKYLIVRVTELKETAEHKSRED